MHREICIVVQTRVTDPSRSDERAWLRRFVRHRTRECRISNESLVDLHTFRPDYQWSPLWIEDCSRVGRYSKKDSLRSSLLPAYERDVCGDGLVKGTRNEANVNDNLPVILVMPDCFLSGERSLILSDFLVIGHGIRLAGRMQCSFLPRVAIMNLFHWSIETSRRCRPWTTGPPMSILAEQWQSSPYLCQYLLWYIPSNLLRFRNHCSLSDGRAISIGPSHWCWNEWRMRMKSDWTATLTDCRILVPNWQWCIKHDFPSFITS